MNTWLSLLAVLGAALLAASSPVTDGGTCFIDDPYLPESRGVRFMLKKLIEPCFKDAITKEMVALITETMELGDLQNFYREFCPNVSQLTTCMAGVRERLAHCQNKNITLPFMILNEISDNLLTAGCENDGERLAYITHAAHLMIGKKLDTMLPLKRCVFNAFAFINLADDAELDLASESYIVHKSTTRLKGCTKHVEDVAYKTAAQWMMDEILTTMKCVHPEEERLIPCSEVDVSKLSVSNECHIKPLSQENLYDQLEGMAIRDCYWEMFNHEQLEYINHTYVDWLKEEYKSICHAQRERPECTLVTSSIGETCLSQEEDKQFQLVLQALEDLIMRACVEDGARLAEIMHHVYARMPEHGHAIRDCYKSIVEASAAHEGYALSTKTMRFYHGTAAFWQCLAGKMHESNDLVQTVEAMMHDVLKKMKCVNPEDGAVVSCESIHEHH